MTTCQLSEGILGYSGELDVILLIGIAIFCGTLGARISQKLHIPQIVGYVTIGIILGPVLKIISQQTIQNLEPFNSFALGIIGFLIGGELKSDIFIKFGKQVVAILVFEALGAFLLVGGLSFLVMYYFAGWQTALAISIVFGAICAATDPASTVNVLWEYKTRGPLTTMLTAIVALDDALALVLYTVGVSVASVITGHQHSGFFTSFLLSFFEIGGSLIMGAAAGVGLHRILKRMDEPEKLLPFTISVVLRLKSFELVHKFSPPIYVLFFVIIGARLNISDINTQIWLLAVAYVVGSTIGKTTGSYAGAVYSKAAPTVRKYLGFCLYQQGTIAVALLLMASSRFEGPLRETMLSVIVIGVFFLQLIGPLFVKMGTKKAGEAGLNITEDDLIKTYHIRDVMDTNVPVIGAGMCLRDLIEVVSSTNNFYYPVVDKDKKLIGAVTLDGIRNTFTTQELNDWLVALDIAEPIIASGTADIALSEAFEKTRLRDIEYLPIVTSSEDDKFIGVLDCRAVRRSLSAQVLLRQQKADSMGDQLPA